jgi:hypothetical protein
VPMKFIMTVQPLGFRFRLWLRDLVGGLVEKFYRWSLTRRLTEFIAAEILARIAHSEIQALQDNQQRMEADDARLDFLYGMYLKLMQVGAGQMSLDDIIRERRALPACAPEPLPTIDRSVAIAQDSSGSPTLLIARRNQALALRHSRSIVRSDIPITSPTSSLVSPPKNRNSTIRLLLI